MELVVVCRCTVRTGLVETSFGAGSGVRLMGEGGKLARVGVLVIGESAVRSPAAVSSSTRLSLLEGGRGKGTR